MNILDCHFKLPRKGLYQGHPFYYKILKDLERIDLGLNEIGTILSIPIWFNRDLNTKFDTEISKAGFNFIKDLFPNNQAVTVPGNLTGYKKKKILNILEKIPQSLKDKIEASPNYYITVYPCKMVDKGNEDIGLKQMSSLHIYNKLISNKTRLPTGFLKWKEDFDITDGETKSAFTFVKSCSKSTFDQTFQYKILTQTLPTKKYLNRYKVLNSNICEKCNIEVDTVLHSIWSCDAIVPYIDKVCKFLEKECNIGESNLLTVKSYLFGGKNIGLNHILLELKKEIFYIKDFNNWSDISFCEYFLSHLR